MKIVIDIPDEDFTLLCEAFGEVELKSTLNLRLQSAVAHGTVLPKGHGRLIDADNLDTRGRGNNSQRTMWRNIDCIVKSAPTIVEADKR